MIFETIAAIVQKAKWPLKWEYMLKKQPTKGVIQICVWQLLLKLLENICEGVNFQKS